jgi:hypothetical protein
MKITFKLLWEARSERAAPTPEKAGLTPAQHGCGYESWVSGYNLKLTIIPLIQFISSFESSLCF